MTTKHILSLVYGVLVFAKTRKYIYLYSIPMFGRVIFLTFAFLCVIEDSVDFITIDTDPITCPGKLK